MGSSSPNRSLVYDEVRQKWVAATPEEQVRQHWLRWMVRQLHYPRELLVVEKEIKELPHLHGKSVPDRRVDILCYGKEDHLLYPLIMIECKEGPLGEKALDQIIGYNHHVGAPFIAVVNGKEARCGFFNEKASRYEFHSYLPSFTELKKWPRQT